MAARRVSGKFMTDLLSPETAIFNSYLNGGGQNDKFEHPGGIVHTATADRASETKKFYHVEITKP